MKGEGMKKLAKRVKLDFGWGLIIGALIMAAMFVIVIVMSSSGGHEYVWIEISTENKTYRVGDTVNFTLRMYGDSNSLGEFDDAGCVSVIPRVLADVSVTGSQSIPLGQIVLRRENFRFIDVSHPYSVDYFVCGFSYVIDLSGVKIWREMENENGRFEQVNIQQLIDENKLSIAMLEFQVEASAPIEGGNVIKLFGSTEFVSVAVDLR